MKSAFLLMVKSRRLGMGSRTALSIDRDFDPAENVLRLEFDSSQVIPREGPLAQGRTVSRQDGWVRLHASDQQVGVQKFESGI